MDEILSYVFSILSILFYGIVYFPEFRLIIRKKSSEGLSAWMIILWNQGDIFSLLGTMLLQLNLSLKIIGWFHYFIGVVMVITVMIYSPDQNKKTNIIISTFLIINFIILILTSILITHLDLFAGELLGWIATGIYISGRFPQLYMNYKRKSTKGLSMLMYIFCMLGNLFYFLSIITYSLEWDYIKINIPWIILVFVLLFLDSLVLIEYLIYKTNDEDSVENDIESNTESISSIELDKKDYLASL